MTILSLRHLMRVLFFAVSSSTAISKSVRPPAVPLVTHDPYFSIWSMNDRLTDGPTRHWTGRDRRLRGLARIDGQSFRWMGGDPRSLPALKQITLTVTPTRTVYRFEQQGVRLEASFLSPLLPDDPDVMSRPITYVTMTARSIDSGFHKIQLLFEAGSELAVDSHTQQVTWSRSRLQGMSVLRASNFQQPVLEKSGDDLRIDWGYLLLAVPDQPDSATVTQAADDVESEFVSGKPLSADDIDMPRRAEWGPVLASVFDDLSVLPFFPAVQSGDVEGTIAAPDGVCPKWSMALSLCAT